MELLDGGALQSLQILFHYAGSGRALPSSDRKPWVAHRSFSVHLCQQCSPCSGSRFHSQLGWTWVRGGNYTYLLSAGRESCGPIDLAKLDAGTLGNDVANIRSSPLPQNTRRQRSGCTTSTATVPAITVVQNANYSAPGDQLIVERSYMRRHYAELKGAADQ